MEEIQLQDQMMIPEQGIGADKLVLTRNLLDSEKYVIRSIGGLFCMRHSETGKSYAEHLVADPAWISAGIIVSRYKREYDVNYRILHLALQSVARDYKAAKGRDIAQDFLTQRGSEWVKKNCKQRTEIDPYE